MSKATLLCVGDNCDFESYKKFKKNTDKAAGFDYININYDAVLRRCLPQVDTDKLIIYFFFPFDYWNARIEPKYYKGVYGSVKFYDRFVAVCRRIKRNVESAYRGKDISYIIPPENMYPDRDKELTKNILNSSHIKTPKSYSTRNIKDIKKLIKTKNLFIKVRYGAMGKGITYLTKGKWQTNFRFSGGKIKSKKSDYGWSFIDVTGNEEFLRQLLKQDIVIEEEIMPLVIDRKKFDLRMYISFGNVRYIYPRTNSTISVTTNISQGGKGEPLFIKKIPKNILSAAKKAAIAAAKSMGTNFAGIDIMIDHKTKKPVIIEVNVFPGFPRSRSFNLSKRILEDIKEYGKTKF